MLTPRQKQAYDFIKSYIQENQCAPTYKDIADGLGVKSRSAARAIVLAIEERGYISRIGHIARGIEIIDRDGQMSGLSGYCPRCGEFLMERK